MTSSVRCSIAFLLVLSGHLVGLHCANKEGIGNVDAFLLTSGALYGGRAAEVIPKIILPNI